MLKSADTIIILITACVIGLCFYIQDIRHNHQIKLKNVEIQLTKLHVSMISNQLDIEKRKNEALKKQCTKLNFKTYYETKDINK